MLIANVMPRKFVFKNNGTNLELPDPDSAWTPETVLNFYTPLYPILATATVEKAVIKDDAIEIKFATTLGTKG